MKYGLTKADLSFLEEVLIEPLKKLGAKVYIFGSRARGTHQKFSDIDILVESIADISNTISGLAELLETSNFPYKVDIVESRNLAASYQPSIKNDRIEL